MKQTLKGIGGLLIGFLVFSFSHPLLFEHNYDGTYKSFMVGGLGVICLFVGIGIFIVALIYLIANLTD